MANGSDSPSFVYLWGDAGSGKTHLLHATCRESADSGGRPALAPLALPGLNPGVLDALEANDVVCIDDLHRVAGNPAWEKAVFGLYERCTANAASLVVAAAGPPGAISIQMPDLVSRLSGRLVYRLTPLADSEKAVALQARARARGFELAPELVRYILDRHRRDTHSLFDLLERLDERSLMQRRRVTLGMVRSLLE